MSLRLQHPSRARRRACIGSSLLLALSVVGCGKSDHALEARAPASEHPDSEHIARAPHKGVADVPELETPTPSDDLYDPSPSELPLTEDFAKAAETRVTPDNYQRELATIERELEQLAPRPSKGALEHANDATEKRAPPRASKQSVSARGVAHK